MHMHIAISFRPTLIRIRWFLIVLTLLAFCIPGFTGNKNVLVRLDSAALAVKSIQAVRIQVPPKIDAVMDEPFWEEVPVAGDFVEYTPNNGTKPPFRTEIRFAYDDVALYIFASMFDPHPDSIYKELGKRDQIEELVTDYISFDILPYNDGLNMYEFKVSPSGIQNDCKYSAIGQDISWDAVWESAAKITSDGWMTELKIPYSALRFSTADKQVWGINMWRNLRRYGEWSTWSFVDNSAQNVFKYYGTLVGIENVKPPRRLSFSPYIAGYTENNPEQKKWEYSLRGGMDLRYGINEAYTLDMMLIPDFGQVQSDDIILNLTPFEVRYNEKRQFFTEATELFNKCEIFYSRRIGGIPSNFNAPYINADSMERVLSNHDQAKIINATKVSGRNSKGLGFGVFNAMTSNTYGTLENIETLDKRKILTQPFTNYNVMVLDKNLKNNSYVTFINTNYLIPSTSYAANVTGTETILCNKKNTFRFLGRFNVSQKYYSSDSTRLGHQYLLGIAKPSGKFQYSLLRQETGNTYDPNEMGFLLNNNEAVNQLILTYQILQPVWKIRNSKTQLETDYISVVKPDRFSDFFILLENETMFKNFWSNYLAFKIRPNGTHDHYESRIWGMVYNRPANYEITWGIFSDSRKKFFVQNMLGIINSPSDENFNYFIETTPRMRFSDRFMITYTFGFNKNLNNYGWVENLYDSSGKQISFFGCRDITTISNVLNARYIFNTKVSLMLRARHYWSRADYSKYYFLNSGGGLTKSDYLKNADISFNAFTVDLNFAWNFAPGSELSVVWKNAIYTNDQDMINNYFRELDRTINSPQTNSFSVRFLYYLDYIYLKKWGKGKKPGQEQ